MDPRQLLSEITSRWQAGDQPNAAAILESHPELKEHHSVVMDLVYEEYCLREEAGETVNLARFQNRFPTIQKSLSRLLAVHQVIQQAPELWQIPEDRWPHVGDTLFDHQFSVLEKLGQGAFARVYLCDDRVHRRLVVIKVTADGTAEAHTLGKLRHPGIVPILDVRFDDDFTAIVMPYLGHNTMCNLLDGLWSRRESPHIAAEILACLEKRGPKTATTNNLPKSMPVDLSWVDGMLWITEKLAESLAYAHTKRILHGDLKPSNVLITAGGYPMLLDFNLAQDSQRDSARVGGTLPYMAPEQLQQLFIKPTEEPVYDTRSEVFALGVILYELLTGKLPYGDYRGNQVEELAVACLTAQQTGPPPVDQQTHICPETADILSRCLQFEPGGRFPTMTALKNALSAIVNVNHHAKLTRRTLLIGSTCVLAGGATLAAAMRTSKDTFKAAIRAYQQQEFHTAILLLSQVDQDDPHQALATYLRGRSRMHNRHFEAAANDFISSFTISGEPSHLAMAGYCLQRSNRYGEAMDLYQQSIQLGDDTGANWNNLGCLHADAGQLELAAKDFDCALKLGDEETFLFNRMYVGNKLRDGDAPSDDLLDLTGRFVKMLDDADRTDDAPVDAPTGLSPLQSWLVGEIYVAAYQDRPQLFTIGMKLLIQAADFGYPTGNSLPTVPASLVKQYKTEISRICLGRKKETTPALIYIVPSPEHAFDINRFLTDTTDTAAN